MRLRTANASRTVSGSPSARTSASVQLVMGRSTRFGRARSHAPHRLPTLRDVCTSWRRHAYHLAQLKDEVQVEQTVKPNLVWASDVKRVPVLAAALSSLSSRNAMRMLQSSDSSVTCRSCDTR